MKKWMGWTAALACVLTVGAAAAEPAAGEAAAPAALTEVAGQKGDAVYMDLSSLHVTDADGDDVMVEVIMMGAAAEQRVTIGRAEYRLSGNGTDFVRGKEGNWEPAAKGSVDEACAKRIRQVMEEPDRRAQFVTEIQQVLMKKWEAQEAAKAKAAAEDAVSVTIETAAPSAEAAADETAADGEAAAEEMAEDAAVSAEKEPLSELEDSASASEAAAGDKEDAGDRASKVPEESEAVPGTADAKKNTEGVAKKDIVPVKDEAVPAEKGGTAASDTEKAAGEKKNGGQKGKEAALDRETLKEAGAPDVVVEITSHEPQVTIEPLPSVEIRPEGSAPRAK